MTVATVAPPSRDSRLPSLTGMRFLAAVLVFVTHVAVADLFLDAGVNRFLHDYLSRAGYLGVEFFFVLSGFVLTWSAPAGDTPRRFLRRRFVKIYPNHFVTWFAGLLLMLWYGRQVSAGNTVPSLLLVQSWSPDLNVLGGTNGPSWTLACELLFYLSFPWLHPLLKRIPAARLWVAAGLVTAAVGAVPLLAQLLPDTPMSPFQPVSWWKQWFVYFLPAPRLLEFVLGILMALIVRNDRWIGLGRVPALALVAAGYALMVLLPDAYGLVAPAALPLALMIAAWAHGDTHGRRSLLAGRLMVWLGEVSFAFYIVHFLVFEYGPMGLSTQPAAARAGTVPHTLGVVAVTFALSLAFGWLLYTLVERPAMRRWRSPRRAGAPAAAPDPTEPAAVTTTLGSTP
ncbi:acyltransferase [Microbispora sp. NPDC046973]|uniref:acyltransferase family protein n=1 Tax=Microbispora sp. NPDC046973 TaxID=3155022 RepID=UPI0033D3EC29